MQRDKHGCCADQLCKQLCKSSLHVRLAMSNYSFKPTPFRRGLIQVLCCIYPRRAPYKLNGAALSLSTVTAGAAISFFIPVVSVVSVDGANANPHVLSPPLFGDFLPVGRVMPWAVCV